MPTRLSAVIRAADNFTNIGMIQVEYNNQTYGASIFPDLRIHYPSKTQQYNSATSLPVGARIPLCTQTNDGTPDDWYGGFRPVVGLEGYRGPTTFHQTTDKLDPECAIYDYLGDDEFVVRIYRNQNDYFGSAPWQNIPEVRRLAPSNPTRITNGIEEMLLGIQVHITENGGHYIVQFQTNYGTPSRPPKNPRKRIIDPWLTCRPC